MHAFLYLQFFRKAGLFNVYCVAYSFCLFNVTPGQHGLKPCGLSCFCQEDKIVLYQ